MTSVVGPGRDPASTERGIRASVLRQTPMFRSRGSVGRMLDRIRHTTGATIADIGVACLLGIVSEIDLYVGSGWQGPRPLNAAVNAALAVALLWRRRRPLAVLGLVATAAVVLSLAFGSSDASTGFFFVVVAVYSAAAHARNPALAAGIVAVAIGVHDLRDPKITSFGDAIYAAVVVALVFLFGLGMRARQARTALVERERDQVAATAVEAERRRIARELHDIISHSLGVLVLQAGAAEQMLERDPERARQALRSIRLTGQQAIGEMGALLALARGESSSSREPQPSLADLERLVARMREAGLRADLEIEPGSGDLSAALELSAFRIVQEGLTNALKHAGDANVHVVVRCGDDELEVEVSDNGKGAAGARGSRRGLAGIGERVALFDGRFEAGPQPEGGWMLRAVLPRTR
jgi:signal transduction histidine kinase